MSLPTDAQFFSREDPSKPDHAFLKNHFYREGRISEEHALYILEKGTEILRAEPNLLYVDAPVTGMSPLSGFRHLSSPTHPRPSPSLRRYPWSIRMFNAYSALEPSWMTTSSWL